MERGGTYVPSVASLVTMLMLFFCAASSVGVLRGVFELEVGKSSDIVASQIPSLLLQASLSVHQLYLYAFVVVTLALFFYKGVMLPYPPTGAFSWEIVLLVLYYCVASTRLFQASKGNQTRQVGALLFALVLAMPLIVCQVYFLQLQTYVLRLDAIVNGIALGLICGESMLCLLTLLSLLGRASL